MQYLNKENNGYGKETGVELSNKKTWQDPTLTSLSVNKTENGTGGTVDGPPEGSYS